MSAGKNESTPNELSRADVADQLRVLGVKPGGVLLVHTSFRAVRPVEGGPLGLIEALRLALGPEGTLVMPCWCASADEPFDPRTTPAAPDLGVVADTFWRLPDVLRAEHLFAFAAADTPWFPSALMTPSTIRTHCTFSRSNRPRSRTW